MFRCAEYWCLKLNLKSTDNKNRLIDEWIGGLSGCIIQTHQM